MKIIDIRNTQSGWIADVLLNEKSMLPISIPVAEVGYSALEDFADSDPAHRRTADPRTPEQRIEDEELADQLATYNELRMSGYPF